MSPRTKAALKEDQKEHAEKPKKTVRKAAPRKSKKAEEAVPVLAHPKVTLKEHVAPEKKIYVYGVGRRKGAVARVRLYPKGSGSFMVNGKSVESYFPHFEYQKIARMPLEALSAGGIYDISVHVHGGGMHGQSGAVRLGLARTLVAVNHDFKTTLRSLGFLTRDPRVKERKKPGLKRARRAPQFSKR